jgi:long-subunit fatty acid transport protein
MIKKSIIIACLFLSLMSLAQEGTSSPYSFYGIGDIRFKGAAENRSMAGLAIAPDSIHINLQNPAGYSDLKLTSFSIGGTYNTTSQKTDTQSGSARRTTLDYLAVGLPLGKFGMGFGLIPYSSVGYKIKTVNLDGISTILDGSGGMNKVFLGLGYKLGANLSVGADAQYNFGTIKTTSFIIDSNIANGTSEVNTSVLSGINFNLGVMYQEKITKKMIWYSSVIYTVESTLASKSTKEIAISGENLSKLEDARSLKLPSKLSFGIGLGENRKWLIGTEVSLQSTGNLVNFYNEVNNSAYNVVYGTGSKYTIGGYFIPNYKSYTSYAKRITYRGGLKYEKTGLIIDSESINDMGFTLGMGMPLSGTFSNINFGFELGKKGTTTANLVQENYANINIGFSLNEKWFEKRKFN